MTSSAGSTSHRRVYLPLTPSLLGQARDAGGLTQPPLAAHAVTDELVRDLGEPTPGEEESEYAALTAASLESLTLLRPDEPPRRVVVAVDVPAWEPRPGGDQPSAVSVPTPLPWRRVVAIHVDGAEAAADVAAALGGASDAVERCLDHELGWYAVQEVDELLRDLSWGEPPGRATIG